MSDNKFKIIGSIITLILAGLVMCEKIKIARLEGQLSENEKEMNKLRKSLGTLSYALGRETQKKRG